ncbi:hypothetical protein U9M48_027039 [Paspalum notatum var. saurae]|uniref:SWIM-type domain-containing protein n=1 Tax=Paspalum notatum var. saurae TaxID=547442 RepID=A0AAQ3WZK8_PASNO
MEMLNKAIGSPIGLVISTDAGKGNRWENRECMRHLVKNFQKRYRGEVFERNLWLAAMAYRRLTYKRHYKLINEACPEAMKWLIDNHKLLWTRSMFSHISKCDYCTNNIAETFNSWVRNEKSLPVIDLLDKIRHMIMERFCTRAYIAAKLTRKILPHVTKGLHDKSRNLKFSITKCTPMVGEVGGVNKDLIPWRFTVDLEKKECSCRYWQMSGPSCVHAIAFIGTRRVEPEDFVDKYYSVQKFKVAYTILFSHCFVLNYRDDESSMDEQPTMEEQPLAFEPPLAMEEQSMSVVTANTARAKKRAKKGTKKAKKNNLIRL